MSKSIYEIDFEFTKTSDQFKLYKLLHDGGYAACHDPSSNTWGAFKYHDVKQVLTDHKSFSASALRHIMNPEWLDKRCHRAEIIHMQDPPESDNGRKLISHFFAMKNINALIPAMHDNAKKIALEFHTQKSSDFVENFSYPYIASILKLFLGIDFNVKDVALWIRAIESQSTNVPEPKIKAEIESTILKQKLFFLEIIKDKRQHTGNDFVSKIINENGDNINDSDLINIIELMVSAGFHTTIHLLSQIVIHFSKNPNLKAILKNSSDLITDFVSESLRFYPTVHFTVRKALKDTMLPSGVIIPKNSHVRAIIAAANRDPNIYVNPNDFDIKRDKHNKYLTFGIGPHSCLGSALAQAETCEAVSAIVNIFNDITLIDTPLTKVAVPTILGFNSLHISTS